MFFISSMKISNGTNIKVLMCLVLNFIVLVKCDMLKMVDTPEEEPGNKFLRYAAYIPTLATTLPAHFPVFFIDDKPEIPRNRFGFNVIYGIPNTFDGIYPISIDFKNSLNYNPSEYLFPLHSEIKDPLLSKQSYANNFPFVPAESVANPHESKIPAVTVNDDWSSEEEEKSHESKQYKPPSTTNIYRKFNKPTKPSPVSYVNDYRPYPQKPVEGNLKNSRNSRIYGSQKDISSSSQRFHKPDLKSNRPAEKLHHREAFKSHPQRKLFSKTSMEPFRPSPPDVFLNSHQSQADFSSDYSNSMPKYYKFGNFTEDIKVHTCVRTNKTDTQVKYPKKIRYCYACVDNKSGTRFEQCTYEETPLKYHSHNQKTNAPTRVSNMHFRTKRELISKLSKEEKIRNKRQEDYYEPNKSHPYETYNQNYRFGPEHFVDDEGAAENEETSYETDQPNEKCWKRRKGEMLCIACENTNTGGTYEQCSYASDPDNTSFEQSVSREYGSSRFAEDDGRRQYTDAILVQPTTPAPSPLPQPHQEAPLPINHADRAPNMHPVPYNNGNYIPNTPPPPPKYIPSYRIPPLPVPPVYTVPANTYFHDDPAFNDNFGRFRFNGLNNYRNPYNSYGDSFSNIFPEIYSNPEPLSEFDDESDDGEFSVSMDDEEGQFTMNNKHKIPQNSYPGYSDKINRKEGLKRALFEMSHKNKTGCKKLIKNKMTCYQCIDDKGSKREDCIYFKPKPMKNNKMTYHNYSEFNSTPKNDHIVTQTVINKPETRLVTPRGRYIPPHIINNSRTRHPYHSVIRPKSFNEGIEWNRYARSSDNKENVANPYKEISSSSSTEKSDHLAKENESTIKNESIVETDNSSEKETKKELKMAKTTEKYNSVPPEPKEFKEFKPNTEGKFSKDTELMFDPILGISLPKYMLKKSEHEAIFDEILASG